MNEEILETTEKGLSAKIPEKADTASIPSGTIIEKRPKKKKSILKIVIFIIIILLIALAVFRAVTGKKEVVEEKIPPVNVKVTTAELASLATMSPLTGRIEPSDEVAIMSLTSGKVARVNVKLGDQVSAGMVLFEIDQSAFTATYNQAQDSYNSAQLNYSRMATLYSEGAVSLQQYEQAGTSLVAAETALSNASKSISDCTVTSPISGTVTALNIDAGSVASPGSPAATIANTNQLEIQANVSEFLISKIKTGDPVDIYIKSLSEEPFKGSIKTISPAPAAGNLTYPITVSISAPTKDIKAGMFTEVHIISDEKDKVLCVPSDAVIVKDSKAMVAVLENKLPVFKLVETGVDNGKFVEIKSGLNIGDTIITQGQHYVKEGEAVTVIK